MFELFDALKMQQSSMGGQIYQIVPHLLPCVNTQCESRGDVSRACTEVLALFASELRLHHSEKVFDIFAPALRYDHSNQTVMQHLRFNQDTNFNEKDVWCRCIFNICVAG